MDILLNIYLFISNMLCAMPRSKFCACNFIGIIKQQNYLQYFKMYILGIYVLGGCCPRDDCPG